MATLKILTFPDERLRRVAQPVKKITSETQVMIDNMIETMYYEKGIGLAATQVAFHQRIVVIDVSSDYSEPMILINPEIVDAQGEKGTEEGCLSIPGIKVLVQRATELKLKALNRYGEELHFDTSGLLSICIQHELDHLEGRLLVDYLSPLKRKRIENKFIKIRRFSGKKYLGEEPF